MWRIDAWTLHVIETFLGVVRRPRFEFTVGEIQYQRSGVTDVARIEVLSENDIIILEFGWNPLWASLVAYSKDDALGCFTDGFKFRARFNRSRPTKIRKTALLFVKKLKNKPVYDVIRG